MDRGGYTRLDHAEFAVLIAIRGLCDWERLAEIGSRLSSLGKGNSRQRPCRVDSNHVALTLKAFSRRERNGRRTLSPPPLAPRIRAPYTEAARPVVFSWGGRVCPLKPEVRKFTKVFQGPGNFLLMMDGDFLKACGKAFRSWE